MVSTKRFTALCVGAALALGMAGHAAAATSLTFWSGFTGGDKGAYEDLIQAFNASHPDIHVDYQLQPWDSIGQKLPTAIISGSGPDLATPDYNVATVRRYVANGLALPLTDLIGSGPNQVPADAIPPVIKDAFSVDGTLYAVPANFATLLLYYNKDLLKAAGLAAAPATMADLRTAAVRLSNGKGQYGIALADNATIQVWPVLIWADGGDLIAEKCSALGDAKTIGAVESWAALIRDHAISPAGATGQDADNLFAAGKAAFEINGPWAAGAYKAAKVDFAVAPVPVGASGKPVTLASTVPLIVSAKSAHPKEALQFLAWWMSKDTQAQLSKTAGYVPSRTDMANDPAINGNPVVAAFTAQVPSARLYLATQKDFGRIDTGIFIPAIQSAEQNGDAAAALTSASARLNKLLGCK